jgi:hypothetical protein
VNDNVNRMNYMLGFTILKGHVGVRDPQLGAMRQEEGLGGQIVELTSIVVLDGFDSAAGLSNNISKKIGQSGEGVRFEFKRKSQQIMSEIIKDDKIIFRTQHAKHRRCSKIKMH